MSSWRLDDAARINTHRRSDWLSRWRQRYTFEEERTMRFWSTLRGLGLVAALALIFACGRTSRDFAPPGRSQEDPAPAGSGAGGDSSAPSAEDGGTSAGGAPASGDAEAGAPASEPEPEPGPGPGPEPEPKPEPEPPSDCTRRNESQTDPNTGQKWTSVWYCGNDGGAKLYQGPSYGAHVATMDSVSSWFVCYQRGAQHAGNNNVWYYTQGDRATAGWGSRAGWGYMAAVNVHTQNDPNPGIPQCAAQ